MFLPPLTTLEDYLAFVSAVESVAAELKMPAHLEGYPPPFDPRLQVIGLSPDPGVLEVNIHPASDCKDAWRPPASSAR